MTLAEAMEGKEYIIQGDPITVVARRRGGCVVSIKDGRYNIDQCLAAAISI